MKKNHIIKSKIFGILLLMVSTASCNSQNTTIPYDVGKSFVFQVMVTDSNSSVLIVDTLTLEIKNKGIIGGILGMNMAEWTSTKYPNNKRKRGFNLEIDMVEMQTPLNYDYLENENIVIAGYPSFSTSDLVGTKTNSKHYFPKSYGSLAGKEVKQYSEVVDSSKINYKNKIIDCQVSEYKNLNLIDELGQYKLKTYYNQDYGFVKMEYKYPKGKAIVFQLIGIKDEP